MVGYQESKRSCSHEHMNIDLTTVWRTDGGLRQVGHGCWLEKRLKKPFFQRKVHYMEMDRHDPFGLALTSPGDLRLTPFLPPLQSSLSLGVTQPC